MAGVEGIGKRGCVEVGDSYIFRGCDKFGLKAIIMGRPEFNKIN